MPDFEEHEVTIKVRHYRNAMFFRQAAGEGKVEGHQVELSVNVAGYTPIIRFPDDEPKGAWLVPWEGMVNAVFPLAYPKEAK